MTMHRQFVAYFFFCGWDCFSLGIHCCVSQPNAELHVPFGFLRIGFVKHGGRPHSRSEREFGLVGRWI